MPRLRAVVAAALVALCIVGCSGTRSEPTEVDEARLDELAAAPPFDAEALGGEWMAEPARAAAASSGALAERATLSTEVALPASSDGSAALPDAWQRVLPAAQTIADELDAGGWRLAGVACTPAPAAAGEVTLVATRALGDGSVAAVRVQVDGDAETIVADAHPAFHADGDDPWGLDALDEPTCLDAETAPTAAQVTGDVEPLDTSVPRP